MLLDAFDFMVTSVGFVSSFLMGWQIAKKAKARRGIRG